MKKVLAPIVGIGILLLIANTNILQALGNFALWLIKLDLTSPDVSIGGQIVIKVLTFLITYAAVGALFNALNWFDSDVMHIVYVVISTILSFVFCHVFHFVEANALWIGIGIAFVVVAGTVWIVVARVKETRS